jgi:Uma2 family endonuclease
MSARPQDLIEEVEEVDYPESDGEPMAETDTHRQLMVALIESLSNHFAEDPEVYVSGNLLLYYVEGDPTKSVAPDVFVVRGVPKGERRIYKLWEEGRAPQVVIELSSRKTKNEDLKWKRQLYAWLGVTEYFIFDPEYTLKPPLRAFRLRGGQLVEEAVTAQRVMSRELGLELVNDGRTLRLFNPQTGEFLLTPWEEAAAHRAEAEARRRAEQRAEHEAERAERLAAKLRELGLDPDKL